MLTSPSDPRKDFLIKGNSQQNCPSGQGKIHETLPKLTSSNSIHCGGPIQNTQCHQCTLTRTMGTQIKEESLRPGRQAIYRRKCSDW